MDIRAGMARHYHQAAQQQDLLAAQYREQRNELMRSLRREGWTYKAIASAVGCSPELAAAVTKSQVA